MESKKRYSDQILRDKNALKRYLQRRRLADALSVLDGLDENFSGRIMDFGGGSGELAAMIAGRFPRARVFCYEPSPDIFAEAKQRLFGLKNATPVRSLKKLKRRRFEYIFCLEVFEHLPRYQTKKAIYHVNRLLREGGIFVVGVPNELFLPALVKGLFRMTRRFGAYDARLSNVLRATLGKKPRKRPTREIAPGFRYHFYHTGFDHRELREQLSETFEPVREFTSPGGLLRLEIYLVFAKVGETSGPGSPTESGS